MREDEGALVPLVASDTIAAAFHGVAIEPPSAVLAGIRCPVLLIAASEMVAELGQQPLDRFRVAVPQAEVMELDSGHDLLVDALEPTLTAVGDFAARNACA